jgi:hypothetical protein
VNRVHAVGPQPVTITRRPHLASRRFEQTVLRKATLTIRHAFEKVLTVGNYNLRFRKTRKHFELGIELSQQPNIVRIEKPDKLTTRQTSARIPRAAWSTAILKSQYT